MIVSIGVLLTIMVTSQAKTTSHMGLALSRVEMKANVSAISLTNQILMNFQSTGFQYRTSQFMMLLITENWNHTKKSWKNMYTFLELWNNRSFKEVYAFSKSNERIRQLDVRVNCSVYDSPLLLFEDLKGHIEWDDNTQECVSEIKLIVEVASDLGLKVRIHKINVGEGYKFHLKSFGSIEFESRIASLYHSRMKKDEEYLIRSSFPDAYDFARSVFPEQTTLLMLSNRFEILLEKVHSYINDSSFINISYDTQLLTTMPMMVYRNFNHDVDHPNIGASSLYMYNCSFANVVIPQEYVCDRVHHCVGGEDEMNCSYHPDNCGGWIPYKTTHCLKIVTKVDLKTIPLTVLRAMLNKTDLNLKDECQSRFKSEVITLFDPNVTDILHLTLTRMGLNQYDFFPMMRRRYIPTSSLNKPLYRYVSQEDGQGGRIVYDMYSFSTKQIENHCLLVSIKAVHYSEFHCRVLFEASSGYICMKTIPTNRTQLNKLEFSLQESARLNKFSKFSVKLCSDESEVQTFHPCPQAFENRLTHPWSKDNIPLFPCSYGNPVHYTLTCDGKDDCADGSDERLCKEPQLSPTVNNNFVCSKVQIIFLWQRCNVFRDCFDGSDEENCLECKTNRLLCPNAPCCLCDEMQDTNKCKIDQLDKVHDFNFTYFPFGTVEMDGYGLFNTTPRPADGQCPDSHFDCPNGFCIPTYMINNGEQDCPDGRDENIPAQSVRCPGYYRCHQSGACVHDKYLCDGIYHCPFKDDEMYCHVQCPVHCTCEGFAFTCQQMFDPYHHLQVRYLDLSRVTGLNLSAIHFLEYLHFLNLSDCELENITLTNLTHLRVLDLSWNLFNSLDDIELMKLEYITHLNLSFNTLAQDVDGISGFSWPTASMISSLKNLQLENVNLHSAPNRFFKDLKQLTDLHLENNPLEDFDKEMLWGLTSLKALYVNNPKLCCSYFHYAPISVCEAPVDELSSCSDLLRDDFFRVLLWIFSTLSIIGNTGVLIYRLFNVKTILSYHLLVINLSLADFLTGLYLMIIGVVDIYYHGVYVSSDRVWKRSVLCKATGILGLISSEVSIFIICIITLDRLLVIRFPLHRKIHLTPKKALSLCAVAWCVGAFLAVVPLFPQLGYWQFYGQTGICVPLPVTRQDYPGKKYSFYIFIVLNLVLFFFILAGQTYIYLIILGSRKSANVHRNQHDNTVARRLFVVIVTNFCCWFPISVMGLLASNGFPIPGEAIVLAAILLLPLNSVLNPFLYTLNAVVDNWRKRKSDLRLKRMMNDPMQEISQWPTDALQEMVRYIFVSGFLESKNVINRIDLVNGTLKEDKQE